MTRNTKPDFSAFVNTDRISLAEDLRKFLLWARDLHPGVFITWAEITQRINSMKRTPSYRDKQVEATRNAVGRARVLMERYDGCSIMLHAISGARATVDTTELVRHRTVKVVAALNGAQTRLARLGEITDLRKITDKSLKAWYAQSIVPVIKAIADTNFAQKLLPPPKEPVDESSELAKDLGKKTK